MQNGDAACMRARGYSHLDWWGVLREAQNPYPYLVIFLKVGTHF